MLGSAKSIGEPTVGCVTFSRASRLSSMSMRVVIAGVMPAVGIWSGRAVPAMIVPVPSAG